MNKSISFMGNAQEICANLRSKFYGEAATARDYKDSFVINHAVDTFTADPAMLMSAHITDRDRSTVKTSKSITFRSDCFEKLTTISKILLIPEAEVCRRILYYSLDTDDKKNAKTEMELSVLKGKIAVLNSQIEASRHTLSEIMDEIAVLEGKEVSDYASR